MKIFVCLDDNNGMMFNHRRQSRDAKVLEDGTYGWRHGAYDEPLLKEFV